MILVHHSGPMVSVQGGPQFGGVSAGVSAGGALDATALAEAAALLRRGAGNAIEMGGFGGVFETLAPSRFALTGAVMRARMNGAEIAWNRSYLAPAGARIEIGAAERGMFGYLSFAGALAAANDTGLRAGAQIGLAPDPDPQAPMMVLSPENRFEGGRVRVICGPQTDLFSPQTQAAFYTCAKADGANRQGLRLAHPNAPIRAQNAAGLVSDFITAGDIQLTGEGLPFILLAGCQTIGGYPRIGTVIALDLARCAQARAGARLDLVPISLEEALSLKAPVARAQPLIHQPSTEDLLKHQLISGVWGPEDIE